MQRLIAFFVLMIFTFALPFPTLADCEATLAWDQNTAPELGGYRLYMRPENGDYDFDNPEWQGAETECIVPQLDEHTTYYFIVRAYDTNDVESGDSNEVRFSYTDAPAAAIDTGSASPSVDSGSSSGGCFIGSLMIP